MLHTFNDAPINSLPEPNQPLLKPLRLSKQLIATIITNLSGNLSLNTPSGATPGLSSELAISGLENRYDLSKTLSTEGGITGIKFGSLTSVSSLLCVQSQLP